MRKFLTIITLSFVLFFGFFTLAQPAQAQFTNELDRQLSGAAGSDGAGFEAPADPRAVAARLIKFFLSFLGIIMLSYTIYGGFMIMTSAGNEEKMTTGKKTIRNGAIGILIITSAYSITQLAVKLAIGDAAHQGDFIEIQKDQNPNKDPLNRGTTPDAFSPLKKQPDGNFRATF